jgi:hypothetical protein
LADEVIFDSDSTHRINIKFRDPGSAPRDHIRIALSGPADLVVDSAASLPNDGDVDILDWVEILFSVDLAVGASSVNLYLNGVDKLDTVTTLNDVLIGWPTFLTDITIGAITDGTLSLGGSVQELWLSNGYIDWSVGANRTGFTSAGVPVSLGALLDGGTTVEPVLYINRRVNGPSGNNARENAATTGGAFTEVGAVTEESTYPIYPGSTLDVGFRDDDTFAVADALLGDTTQVASGGYGLQQQFLDVADLSIHDMIGATALQQMETSPTNAVPVEIRSSATATGGVRSALKGGVVKNTDPKDLALDTALTPSASSGVRSRIGSIIYDGVRLHNVVNGFDLYRHTASAGVDEDPETGVGNFFELRNCWLSYGRHIAVRNSEYMSGLIEDCLIDGAHTFLSCNNANATVDAKPSFVEIRNCLIWLRMLPYPQGHGGETLASFPLDSSGSDTSWGHGRIFDWDTTNGPNVKIFDSTFYIEHYPATTGASSDWSAGAAAALSFLGAQLTGAENVKVVWGGPGSFPGTIPSAHAAEFSTFNYSDTSTHPDTHFFTPRNDWIANHPLLGTVGDSLFDAAISWPPTNPPYANYPTF